MLTLIIPIVIVILLLLGAIATTYIIAGPHHLAKRGMAAVSYILYFMVSYIVGLLISDAIIPPVANYPTTREVVWTSLWCLVAFVIIGMIFSFAFHKFWQIKAHGYNYSKKFLKGLNIINVIEIIVFTLSIAYTIPHDNVGTVITIIALLSVVIAIILGFVDFFMMIKTLSLRWYLYGLTLQGIFIILVLIGISESCM